MVALVLLTLSIAPTQERMLVLAESKFLFLIRLALFEPEAAPAKERTPKGSKDSMIRTE